MSESADGDRDRRDMESLAGGHDAALNDLMERHGEHLFHYLLRQLQNEADAEDIAQETFVRVYLNRDKFRPDGKFTTWLYSIATNLVRDRFRWVKRHPAVSIDADAAGESFLDTIPATAPHPSDNLAAAETAEQVRLAVQALPEDLRTPLILAEYQNLSHAEIGAILNCTPKAVEMRVYRARVLLKKSLMNSTELV